jgi:hypothetical protein
MQMNRCLIYLRYILTCNVASNKTFFGLEVSRSRWESVGVAREMIEDSDEPGPEQTMNESMNE